MLPIPFEKFIPAFFNRDYKLYAMSNKINQNLNDWKKDILNLNNIIDVARIQTYLLNDIGEYLNAGILNSDSDRTKRQKIYSSVSGHKSRSLFRNNVKSKIDSIAGGDSSIYKISDNGNGEISSDWIMFGSELDDVINYWGTIGEDGLDAELGLDLIGAGTEIEIPGNIYINVDNDSLTNDQINQIKLSIVDIVPAYYIVYLGYLDINDDFVVYVNGIIF